MDYLIPRAFQFLGFLLAFFAAPWLRNLVLFLMVTDGILEALVMIQAGGNYLVWNGVILGLLAPFVYYLTRIELDAGLLTSAKERRLMRRLFGENLGHYFTHDSRLMGPDFSFQGITLET